MSSMATYVLLLVYSCERISNLLQAKHYLLLLHNSTCRLAVTA